MVRHSVVRHPGAGPWFVYPFLNAPIFSAFCPQRVDYVIKASDLPGVLQAMADKDITLIQLMQAGVGQQFEVGLQGRPIPDDVLQFAYELSKYGHNHAAYGESKGVTKQAISKRVSRYRSDFPALFPRYKRPR